MIDPITYSALSQLINRLWSRLERSAYDDVLSLLTEDCRWERNGRLRIGLDEIRIALSERPVQRTVRHQVTSLAVDVDSDLFLCTYLVTAFSNEHALETTPPFSTVTPHVIGECVNRCQLVNGHYRIKDFDIRVLFREMK